MSYYSILKEEWDKILKQPILSYTIFATESNEFGQSIQKTRIIIGIPSYDIEGLYHVTCSDKYYLF